MGEKAVYNSLLQVHPKAGLRMPTSVPQTSLCKLWNESRTPGKTLPHRLTLPLSTAKCAKFQIMMPPDTHNRTQHRFFSNTANITSPALRGHI